MHNAHPISVTNSFNREALDHLVHKVKMESLEPPYVSQMLNYLYVYTYITMQGDDGSPGAAGLPGEKGAQGPTGPSGASGAPGEDGEAGDDGNDGADGDQGAPVCHCECHILIYSIIEFGKLLLESVSFHENFLTQSFVQIHYIYIVTTLLVIYKILFMHVCVYVFTNMHSLMIICRVSKELKEAKETQEHMEIRY